MDRAHLEGDARAEKARELNVLKNRTLLPKSDDIDPAVTLQAMSAPGRDRHRFSSDRAASVTGYVANVIVGGIETTNCHAKDDAERDTHIELVVDPNDANDEIKHVIVEVTPRIRNVMAQQGQDWSTKALRTNLLGRRMTFTGWMLFDQEHAKESANTARPDRPAKVWRATAWEIHPIMAMFSAP